MSEAEWEYVARAGTVTRYWWGNDLGWIRANCADCGSRWGARWHGLTTAPVGSFRANAFGLHDVHGNVSEWVEDCWHDDYTGAPRDGRAWLGGRGGPCLGRVLRGGSWYEEPENLRSASRVGYPTGIRTGDFGFRVARTLAP